jgi:hypothetical protein
MENKTKYAATWQFGEKGYFICKYDEDSRLWRRVCSYPMYEDFDEANAEAARMAARNGGIFIRNASDYPAF